MDERQLAFWLSSSKPPASASTAVCIHLWCHCQLARRSRRGRHCIWAAKGSRHRMAIPRGPGKKWALHLPSCLDCGQLWQTAGPRLALLVDYITALRLDLSAGGEDEESGICSSAPHTYVPCSHRPTTRRNWKGLGKADGSKSVHSHQAGRCMKSRIGTRGVQFVYR